MKDSGKRIQNRPAEPAAPALAPRGAQPWLGLENYLIHHLRAFLASLGSLLRTPFASFMTAVVIGVALALPSGFHALLRSVQSLASGWEGDVAQVSLFLKPEIKDDAARNLAWRLRSMDDVAGVRYISPQQAVDEFQRSSGLSDALAYLDENPLPAVLVVKPAEGFAQPEVVHDLVERLQALPEVESTQLDWAWLKRLRALVALADRAMTLVGAVLAVAVLFIVGNTIRLAIENRREEIVITKLVGATDAFIRRPFIYGGIWYGLAGGLIALFIVDGVIWGMSGPVARLAALYKSDFHLGIIGATETVVILLAGSVLGWLGAWLAVGRHLRHIEPT
ncbi:MAG: permease-like cell division protein FtsX [Gammaproteobacteria bacterium]